MASGNGSGVAVGAGNVGVGETAVSAVAVVGMVVGNGEKTAVGVAVAGRTTVGKPVRLGVGSAGGSGVVMATNTDGGK